MTGERDQAFARNQFCGRAVSSGTDIVPSRPIRWPRILCSAWLSTFHWQWCKPAWPLAAVFRNPSPDHRH